MNKEKKVRFAKSVTSSSNISKNTDSLKTKYSNNPLLTSTDVKPTTSASRSKSFAMQRAEVEHSKPGFELQGAKMVETGQNRDFRLRTARVTTPGLRFLVSFASFLLETSFDVLDSPYDAAAKNERQRSDVANFCTMELLKKVGKSNCYLDAEKSQSNPIYKIAVDILKHTNLFRAFTASSKIPAIYIQQFWDTICYDRTEDEQWFNLTKDTLRDSLQICSQQQQAFSSSTQILLSTVVNQSGYPKEVKHFSNVVTNDLFHPMRGNKTILICAFTGKILVCKGLEL
ncbi:hypothetical protein Tco_0660315 [Tanacetum coccineum]